MSFHRSELGQLLLLKRRKAKKSYAKCYLCNYEECAITIIDVQNGILRHLVTYWGNNNTNTTIECERQNVLTFQNQMIRRYKSITNLLLDGSNQLTNSSSNEMCPVAPKARMWILNPLFCGLYDTKICCASSKRSNNTRCYTPVKAYKILNQSQGTNLQVYSLKCMLQNSLISLQQQQSLIPLGKVMLHRSWISLNREKINAEVTTHLSKCMLDYDHFAVKIGFQAKSTLLKVLIIWISERKKKLT